MILPLCHPIYLHYCSIYFGVKPPTFLYCHSSHPRVRPLSVIVPSQYPLLGVPAFLTILLTPFSLPSSLSLLLPSTQIAAIIFSSHQRHRDMLLQGLQWLWAHVVKKPSSNPVHDMFPPHKEITRTWTKRNSITCGGVVFNWSVLNNFFISQLLDLSSYLVHPSPRLSTLTTLASLPFPVRATSPVTFHPPIPDLLPPLINFPPSQPSLPPAPRQLPARAPPAQKKRLPNRGYLFLTPDWSSGGKSID